MLSPLLRQCYDSEVRRMVGKLFVAGLLTLCLGAQLVELSGRWDHTLQDANDEVGLVAAVLCVGMALTTAGAFLTRLRGTRLACRKVLAAPTIACGARLIPLTCPNRPPIGLR